MAGRLSCILPGQVGSVSPPRTRDESRASMSPNHAPGFGPTQSVRGFQANFNANVPSSPTLRPPLVLDPPLQPQLPPRQRLPSAMSIFDLRTRGILAATPVQPWLESRFGDDESISSLTTVGSEQPRQAGQRQRLPWRTSRSGGYGGGPSELGLNACLDTKSLPPPGKRDCEVERLIARCMTQERPKALVEATAALLDACAVKLGEQVMSNEKRSDKIRRLLRLTDELRRANADLTEGIASPAGLRLEATETCGTCKRAPA